MGDKKKEGGIRNKGERKQYKWNKVEEKIMRLNQCEENVKTIKRLGTRWKK